MNLRLTLAILMLCGLKVFAQGPELVNKLETSYEVQLSEVLKIPLRIKNTPCVALKKAIASAN